MPVAQLVEHLTFNQGVRDSNSRGRTKKHQTNFCPVLFCCVIQDFQHCDSFLALSPLFISSRSSPPSRTGWRRSCRCRWPPWPGTMPRTAPPDGNMPQHLPRTWNTFALGWGMPFADFTHTNNKHRAAMQGVLLLAARCFVVSGYCRVIVSFWQAVCPRPTANPMRRRQGRGTRSGRTAGTRWG